MFLFAHRIDRFPKVLGDMEPIMHDVGLGEAGTINATQGGDDLIEVGDGINTIVDSTTYTYHQRDDLDNWILDPNQPDATPSRG